MLDSQQRLLTRAGEVIPLEPKVIDTLLALVEAEGRLTISQPGYHRGLTRIRRRRRGPAISIDIGRQAPTPRGHWPSMM